MKFKVGKLGLSLAVDWTLIWCADFELVARREGVVDGCPSGNEKLFGARRGCHTG